MARAARTRRALLAGALCLSACAPPRRLPPTTQPPTADSPSAVTAPSPTPRGVSARAMRVYQEAYVVDMHNDMPSKVADEGYDPDVRHGPGFGRGQGHTDLPRLLESGITGQFFAAFVDAPYAHTAPDSSFERALALIDTIHAFTARHPRHLLAATAAADVRRAKREGRVAVLIGVEGGHAIESSLDNLRELYRRGARYMTLTWNNGNQWAGSSIGVGGTSTGGLTPFGRDVVREMNRLGMLVDVSHVSDATFRDVVATTRSPVIASHSSARALHDSPRNLSDEQLRAVARTGGVVCVNFYSAFIDPGLAAAYAELGHRLDAAADSLRRVHGGDPRRAAAELARIREALAARVPPTPLSVLIDHIDHIARVAGVDHVGLGSDFDGVGALPVGLEDVTGLPRIAQALLDRGHAERDVAKILGGNVLRVMQAVLDPHEAPGR